MAARDSARRGRFTVGKGATSVRTAQAAGWSGRHPNLSLSRSAPEKPLLSMPQLFLLIYRIFVGCLLLFSFGVLTRRRAPWQVGFMDIAFWLVLGSLVVLHLFDRNVGTTVRERRTWALGGSAAGRQVGSVAAAEQHPADGLTWSCTSGEGRNVCAASSRPPKGAHA